MCVVGSDGERSRCGCWTAVECSANDSLQYCLLVRFVCFLFFFFLWCHCGTYRDLAHQVLRLASGLGPAGVPALWELSQFGHLIASNICLFLHCDNSQKDYITQLLYLVSLRIEV